MPKDRYLLILSTAPDAETARQIGTALVEMQIAACVNVLPQSQSIYRWQGKVETAEEHTLMIKTNAANLRVVEKELTDRHPYDVPEFIAIPIEAGSSAYLSWISDCTLDG
jgi:periplasmic divalent cation tolerance protein